MTAPELVGTILDGRYELVERLGTGRGGTVYRARHLASGRRVAVKVLSPSLLAQDPGFFERFRRVYVALAAVDHENVCRFYEVGETPDGHAFLAMEYIDGPSLAEEIERRGPWPVADAVRIAVQVARGLDAAHEVGVVHRHVGPESVLITGDPGEQVVKIIDFGVPLQHLDGEGLLRTTSLQTDLRYHSPEQLSGSEVNRQTDVYGLGLTLFETLAGVQPFRGTGPMEVLTDRITRPALRLSEVSARTDVLPALQDLLDCMLAREPGRRPQSAAEAADSLSGFIGDRPSDGRGFTPIFDRPHRPRPEPPDVVDSGAAEPGESRDDAEVANEADGRGVGGRKGRKVAGAEEAKDPDEDLYELTWRGDDDHMVAHRVEDLGFAGAEPVEETVRAEPVEEIDPDPPAASEASDPDEGTDPVRHPSVAADRPLEAGREVELVIDLQPGEADPDTAAAPVAFEGLDPGWATLDVQVEVLCPAIDLPETTGTIVVRRNGPSDPCVLPGTVKDGLADGAPVDVGVTFQFGERLIGMARRTFRIGADTPEDPPPPTSVVVETGAVPPDLQVQILKPDPAAPGRLYWVMGVPAKLRERLPRLPGRMSAFVDLGGDPRGYARGLYTGFGAVTVGAHMDLFNAVGDTLWRMTPPVFKEVYWILRRALGPGFTVQFVTEDPYVPWELMRPEGDASDEAADLLALDHPVARWMVAHEGALRQRLEEGAIRTIAPRYENPMDTLARAQEESDLLRESYGARRVPGRLAEITALLREPSPERTAIVHFAGHGVFDPDAPDQSYVKLEDDGRLLAAVVGMRETVLGERSAPLVVFNACDVGLTGETLGATGGWAEVFLNRRFRGFIAPLWPVFDEAARTVVEELFEGFVDRRQPLGRVLQEIRRAHAETSPTFLAYLYYGDVNARLV